MTGWADPAVHDVGRAYAARLRTAMQPFSTPATSGYINMVDMAEGEGPATGRGVGLRHLRLPGWPW